MLSREYQCDLMKFEIEAPSSIRYVTLNFINVRDHLATYVAHLLFNPFLVLLRVKLLH
jgi:hypothetical protein